ncbi:Fc receptor-like protein 5 isoform X2 [Silurus meridionalis]|uniref:Fc receptor-like protein 5 isoform X2 n=1 Tax=Silurus meridionalis TaxID=175797 RepID=UPI001EEA16FB|nr:Fc receptor-like protein 5 isoform X2 [Silurus meridionalis]
MRCSLRMGEREEQNCKVLIVCIRVPRVRGKSKAVVLIKPDTHVFRGERVRFRCDIKEREDIEWTYSWYKNNKTLHTEEKNQIFTDSTMQEFGISSIKDSDNGSYACRGHRNDSQTSDVSDDVILTVSEKAHVILRVSPQSWLTEGDSVTLSCEVRNSSLGWTFSWYTAVPYRQIRNSRGDIVYGNLYTLSPATLNHTGVYVCESKRGDSSYYRSSSNQQPIWITGKSPPVSLIIKPNRAQHFTKGSLSLRCEDLSNSTRWTVGRYTQREAEPDCVWWGLVTESTCKINSLSTSDSGVYWCESESGGISNPVNITVHDGDVILDSPVQSVNEGHNIILYCLYRNTNSLNQQADIYKDGSVLQNQITGEVIVYNVSESDEGIYHCKHPDRGESPKSWVSVRRLSHVQAPFSVLMLINNIVKGSLYLLVTIILLVKCYKARGHSNEDRMENRVEED